MVLGGVVADYIETVYDRIGRELRVAEALFSGARGPFRKWPAAAQPIAAFDPPRGPCKAIEVLASSVRGRSSLGVRRSGIASTIASFSYGQGQCSGACSRCVGSAQRDSKRAT